MDDSLRIHVINRLQIIIYIRMLHMSSLILLLMYQVRLLLSSTLVGSP